MIKKVLLMSIALLVLSGCVEKNNSTDPVLHGGVMKSSDGAVTFEPKVKAGEKNIANINVLTLQIDPQDNKTIYIGSMQKGIFVTKDGGEEWQKLDFPPVKIYDIVIDPYNTSTLYATGVYGKQAHIYKSTDKGENWVDIYGEPTPGTVVISLAMDRRDPNMLYAGTTTGMIIQSRDGGKTWINQYKAAGPITDIHVDPYNSGILYALHYEKELLISRDGGKTFANISDSNLEQGTNSKLEGSVYSMSIDMTQPGVVFVGTDNGVYKMHGYGSSWESLNVIDSTKGIPIYALAVSPFNNKELIYNVGNSLYKTLDNGNQWSVYQLKSAASVNAIIYDVKDANTAYLGLRERK